MKFIKIKFKDAEKIRVYLADKNIILKNVKIEKLNDSVCFPVLDNIDLQKLSKLFKGIKFELVDLEGKVFTQGAGQNIKTLASNKPQSLSVSLNSPNSKPNLGHINIRGFDVVGDIAIIEIPKNLEKGEKNIAQTILNSHKNIRSVFKKKGAHMGTFRTQKLKLLLGDKNKETTHKEHGCVIKLDTEKVYFSPRISNERKRIFLQVKKGENVLVMFSGCGVYPVTISKNSKAKSVVGIEINPTGHKYALENIKLNKTTNVTCYVGDVKKVIPKLKLTPKQKFDRIIMPLPKDAGTFLPYAFKAAKKGSIIHLYDFIEEKDIDSKPTPTYSQIDKACKKAKLKYKILSWVKCGQIGPRAYRICVDFKIL